MLEALGQAIAQTVFQVLLGVIGHTGPVRLGRAAARLIGLLVWIVGCLCLWAIYAALSKI
jgi:hypothetical protein